MKKTNTDSPFYRTMGRIGDLVLANVLWLVCCLPVITAGASTLGLFTVVNKMAAKEDYTVRADFFKAFKRDFKQATALWLVVLAVGFASFRGLQTATAQDTAHTSYQLTVGPNGMLLHTYYGARLPDEAPNLADPRVPHGDPGCWPDLMPQELSGSGTADNRTPAVIPEYADGTEAAAFVFDHAEVHPGKPQLPGLPMFRDGNGVETLSVFLKDAGGLAAELRYSVYEAEDFITRTVLYTNTGNEPLTLHKAASLCMDFAPDALELITLNGTWAAERTPERAPLRCGIQSIGSMCGIPGHAHNPAVALCRADTTETTGDAWGFALVYSGNYCIEAERVNAGERLVMGVHPYHFHWTLAPGESFAAPEAAMIYSDKGLGEMSRRFHNAIRTRLLPPRWQDMNRSLAHVYNAKLPAKRQGEVYHRYVMGVYELQRRLTEKYPDLLLENCAGGGARFDCGMLYYSPQIWCSDNTDARARLVIQYGTSLFYPGCVMGAHFSTVPNHCTGHTSTVEARMAAALSGTFGFELDLTKYSEEELAELRPYVAWYRTHGALLRGGELHRLVNPDPNGLGAAWMIAAKDGSEAAVFAVGDALTGSHGTASANSRPRLVLEGLDPAAQYTDEDANTYSGVQLLTTGLELPGGWGQTPARIWYLKKV